MTGPTIYTLRAFAETPAGRQIRLFEQTRPEGVSPEQQSAALIWLNARRRETPVATPFEGGVDIFDGYNWIPFTDLLGRDAWSRKVRLGAVS